LSVEEAGSEKKNCSAILLFIYSIKGAPEWSGVEKRGTAVPPLPQSGRQEKNVRFFFSEPASSMLNGHLFWSQETENIFSTKMYHIELLNSP
jgi:hypothetical protein